MSAQHRAFSYPGMISDANLPSHDYVLFDSDTAGNASLSGNDHVRSNLAVVANVDEVVDFRTALNSCFVEGSTINC